jgi:diaminopimelate decarboxylase
MPDFHYRGKYFYCEDAQVAKIAQDVGTPLYVYSHKTLTNQFQKLDEAFAPIDHLVCYSVKANSNIAILRALAQQGAGMDIVSEGELYRAQQAGVASSKIVFAGVGKSESEITRALEAGILCFTVESDAELDLIEACAKRLGRKAPISVRVNPNVNPRTHRYIATGKKESKFGLDFTRAAKMYERMQMSDALQPIGVQIHIGSQIVHTRPFVTAIRKMVPFLATLRDRGIHLSFFDIGGGMGIVYDSEKPSTAKEFAKAVLPDLQKIGLKVLLEPGRFIAGNAGILVCRVQYLKQSSGKVFVIVDAGMNDLLRPSLYHAYHRVVSVWKNRKGSFKADVVGPICESGDFLAKDRTMDRVVAGDLLAVMGAGAYGFTMASNYNSRPRCPEVLVHGNHYDIVRQRESLEQLLEKESIPSFLQ